MRLVSYDGGAGPRAGVVVDDRVVDVTALLGGDRDAAGRAGAAGDGRRCGGPRVGSVGGRRGGAERAAFGRQAAVAGAAAADGARLHGLRGPRPAAAASATSSSRGLVPPADLLLQQHAAHFGPDEDVRSRRPPTTGLRAGDRRGHRQRGPRRGGEGLVGVRRRLHDFYDWSARDLQRDESRWGWARPRARTRHVARADAGDDGRVALTQGRKLSVNCVLKVNGEKWMDNDGGTPTTAGAR